jgi:O-acetyl-ADP-ribose deacetylase (regulator of RNase III)
MAKIQSPHVVAAHDFAVLPSGRPVLVMEWVDGTDLFARARTVGGRIAEAQGLEWMKQTAEGMRAAAEEEIIHRDLKPSNIMIDKKDRARVTDFGLARLETGSGAPSFTSEGKGVLGTPLYMAPEQAEDPRRVDTRSDIYSFGATFYHVLTGTTPFQGKTYFSILFKHKTEPLVSPKARNEELSERSSQILERCLAKMPKDRFQSFEDVIKVLEPAPEARSTSPWEETDDPEVEAFMERYRSRREAYLKGGPAGALDRFEFSGGRKLRIVRGNIVEQPVDAVVSSDDDHLTMGGGVSQAILWAGGSQIEKEAWKFVPVRPGRVIVTSGGKLKARFVFHGVTMGTSEGRPLRPSRDLIYEILTSCFYHADTLNVQRIALPLLGTGVGGFSEELCLDTMVRYLARMLMRGLTSVREAAVVLRAQ